MDYINNTDKFFDATPSYKLIQTMGFGTYTLESAIADIIDNSVTAQAKNIDITFSWNRDIDKSFVTIQDDGYGMSSKELETAMIFSGKGIEDERSESDLGKYGLGMKTASFFSCHCFTVTSKKEGFPITAKRLDQQFVANQKKWIGNDLDDSKDLRKIHINHGTIVRWDKLNFVEDGENSKTFFLENADKVAQHLSLYFHRFLEDEKVIIRINGYKIKPWNPTFTSNIGTTRIQSSNFDYKGQQISINSYLLPSSLKCTEDEIEEMYRGNALKYQGIYVYRNDRLLIGGGWLSLKKLTSHQQYNPVRITVDISSSLDSEFKVDFTKSLLKFPSDVEERIIKISQVARSKASEAYKNRANKVRKPGMNTNDEVWNVVQNKKGTTLSINVNHPLIKMYTSGMNSKDFKALMKLLSKSVPSVNTGNEETNTFSNDEIKAMIEKYFTAEMVKSRNVQEVYEEMCNLEPFVNYLDLLQSYFEEEVLINVKKL